MQEEGHGGFDCSGFTWRVMFGSGLGEDDLFGGVLAERTSYAMSAIPRKQRIKDPNQLQPGDIMFWGSKGGKSKPSQNYHAGISMGNGWFIHSSGSNGGVTITRLEGYWLEQFSWGRKYLR